jgi:long-chain acyl-CoA synthetase
VSINVHAQRTPDKVAVAVVETGATLTYAQLDDASARLARLLRERGAKHGDRVSVLMDNRAEYLVAVWAARRCGLRSVPINWHLKTEEAAYVVDNSDSVALITSQPLLELAETVRERCPQLKTHLVFGPAGRGFESVEAATAGLAPWPMTDEPEGALMPYSSGTSGRPKGILRPLADTRFGDRIGFEQMVEVAYGFSADTVYLCPAPLYHTAPIGWSMATLANGGTLVVLHSYDPEQALKAIETHRVTHAQFVPTHFIRMLKLPEAARSAYDLSSLKFAIHAAAPCPVEVKEAMIAWWGPIIYEYYAGSEGGGFVSLNTEEWLKHRGSVGKVQTTAALGMGNPGGQTAVHIVDPETGEEVKSGDVGVIYFAAATPFDYYKDPGKTAEFFNDKGWGTLGDMGWIDGEGYLYLTDRKSHMIISGGVNIYPQEIESVLALHPAVADVGVIGVPNAEFGEEVKAVVQPAVEPSEALAEELMAYCRERLAGYKCPRTVDFAETLPRLPNGKLLKRELRKPYWPETGSKVI